jgi:hypothetical protein
MVRIHPDPPANSSPAQTWMFSGGAIAQLGERLLCKQEVIGSIPIGSTSSRNGEESAISCRMLHARLIGASS